MASGGRVLGVTALGADVAEAQAKAYQVRVVANAWSHCSADSAASLVKAHARLVCSTVSW